MLNKAGVDLIFESLKDCDSKTFEIGDLGEITLELVECPTLWHIGVKFSGHINLGKAGIQVPEEAKDSIADAILHVVWAEAEAKKKSIEGRERE